MRAIRNALNRYRKYEPLLKQLVSRDLKVKYRRSFLGYVWSLLNPLMMMAVLTVVFSYMFRFDIPNYPLYMITGQTLWTFFNESTNMCMYSIIQNGALIRKVYIPKYIFPVSRVLSSFVTMSFSLAAIVIVMLFTKAPFYWTILLFPIPLLLLLLFSMGIGMVLSSLSVYFRDIIHLYGVFTLAWMYLTPIFYPLSALPEGIAALIAYNPMFCYIDFFRDLVLNGVIPGAQTWLLCIGYAIVALIGGSAIFGKLQKRFILYI